MSLFFLQANSIEPDEMLEDSRLEKIAREIGKELRCLVCQNEDIQNSNADIAKDLRKIVRKKLLNGESKKQIIDYIQDGKKRNVSINYLIENEPLGTAGSLKLLPEQKKPFLVINYHS